jgi:ATP-dependent Clp protease adaptor protein ClpS
MSVDVDVKIDEKIKVKNKQPNRYKVVILNDDKTPIEFVVSILIKIFKHTEESAMQITMKIHEEGSGVVGVYSYEIAEQKAVETTTISRDNGFPLRVRVEEE